MYREMQATEREERAAEREMKKAEREIKKAEMERDVKLRELEVREKELTQGIGHGAGSKSDTLKSKLPKFQEGQDPDVFLRSFEKLVTLHKIHKSEWPLRLVPLLCGKALEAYARLSEVESRDYDSIKTAILVRYELTSEVYRGKFRHSTQMNGESFREYSVRLEGFLRHWCEREEVNSDFDKFYDLVLREQLIVSSDRELGTWIQERRPTYVKRLIELAESYQIAHKNYGKGNKSGNDCQRSFNQKTILKVSLGRKRVLAIYVKSRVT